MLLLMLLLMFVIHSLCYQLSDGYCDLGNGYVLVNL